jgi:GrpB-like predicted nucleotidyltransferase (UPF0157 family)
MPKPRIILLPHDPRWARAFAQARAAIMEACGDYVLDVVHVGSTAIPGIAAKPVIDMVGLLRRHRNGFAYVSAMVALGFEFRGEAGLSGRPFSGAPRTHHVRTRRITRKSDATSAFATTCAGIPIRHPPTRP